MGQAHKRLIGLWQSDRRRTLEDWHPYYALTGARKRRLEALFGHLKLRYTRTFVYHSLPGFRHRARYEVVAEDVDRIVIRVHSEELKRRLQRVVVGGPVVEQCCEPKLELITFTRHRGREYYWVGEGMYCEWFKRVGARPRGPTNPRRVPDSRTRGRPAPGDFHR